MKTPLLEELLMRVNHGMLTTDISNEIVAYNLHINYPSLRINCALKQSTKYENPPDYYIVINFKEPNKKLGHITFHLIKGALTNTGNGLLHIVNNSSGHRRRRLRVTKIQQCISLSIGTIVILPHNINNFVSELSECAIRVMNRYLEDNTSESLLNRVYPVVDNQIIEHVREIIYWNMRKRGGHKTYTKINHRRCKMRTKTRKTMMK